ncbi:hypothetical protein XENORESO_015588 [Xenotaenia resolanae]|uniref:Uncharacterized protein n=1 Tax=Xenotaenia resolanae TaxID=208358 RepID=A0ABV0WN02_9TELE
MPRGPNSSEQSGYGAEEAERGGDVGEEKEVKKMRRRPDPSFRRSPQIFKLLSSGPWKHHPRSLRFASFFNSKNSLNFCLRSLLEQPTLSRLLVQLLNWRI